MGRLLVLSTVREEWLFCRLGAGARKPCCCLGADACLGSAPRGPLRRRGRLHGGRGCGKRLDGALVPVQVLRALRLREGGAGALLREQRGLLLQRLLRRRLLAGPVRAAPHADAP